jgi:hypothetical protein
MDPVREYLLKTWDEGWEKSAWWPAFSIVCQDLTPAAGGVEAGAAAPLDLADPQSHVLLARSLRPTRARRETPG